MSVLLVLTVCLSLCGCARLDEMKARHAVWQEDGAILWNDAVYKPLPAVMEAEVNRMRLDDIPLHVTEVDVPVLLSALYGDYFECDKEGVFLRGYTRNNTYYGEYTLFCREDHYEEVAAELTNGFVTKGLCYDYFDSQLNAMRTYYVTAEQEYAISFVLDTAEWFSYDDEFYAEYEVQLYRHDALDLYREYEMLLMYTGGGYYLVQNDIAYLVPTDYEQTMQDILQVGYNAESNRYKEWYE